VLIPAERFRLCFPPALAFAPPARSRYTRLAGGGKRIHSVRKIGSPGNPRKKAATDGAPRLIRIESADEDNPPSRDSSGKIF